MLIKLKYHRQITMIIECRSIRSVIIILTCTLCRCICIFFVCIVMKMSTKITALKNTLDDIIILNLRERMRGKIISYNVMTIDYSSERLLSFCGIPLLNFAFFIPYSFVRHSWNYEALFSGWKLFYKKRIKTYCFILMTYCFK
jgi:hypothetical protein